VARWLASQNAGQCGPCMYGLPAVADALEAAVSGRPVSVGQVGGLVSLVKGRGACKHPDGMARFVESSLRVFNEHVVAHQRQGPCVAHRPLLPVPETGGWR